MEIIIKEKIKLLLKKFLEIPFYLFKSWEGVLVLTYHSVNNFHNKSHSTEMFERQLDWLISNNYRLIKTSEIERYKNHKKIVCITFDDGYLDNFEVVLPILIKKKVFATFFIVSDWISNKNLNKHHSYDLPTINEKHLKLMSDSGMEIGCHTHSHRQASDLIKESIEFFYNDINLNKNILEKILNKKITSFAYPNGQKGSYNNLTNEILCNSFDRIFTSIHGKVDFKSNIYGRIEMSHLDDFNDFKSKILGRRRYLSFYQKIVNQSKKWYV